MCIRDRPNVCPKPLSKGSKVTLVLLRDTSSIFTILGFNKLLKFDTIRYLFYLEYNSTTNDSFISEGKSILSGTALKVPSIFLLSTVNHEEISPN